MTNLFAINVEAAIYKDGKWLVGVRSKNEVEAAGLLSLIGGTIEHSDATIDTLESAIAREVEEEICVKVKAIDFVNSSSFVSKRNNHVINIVMLCEIISGEPKISNTQELDELLWLSEAEIISYPGAPKWLCASIQKASSLVKN